MKKKLFYKEFSGAQSHHESLPTQTDKNYQRRRWHVCVFVWMRVSLSNSNGKRKTENWTALIPETLVSGARYTFFRFFLVFFSSLTSIERISENVISVETWYFPHSLLLFHFISSATLTCFFPIIFLLSHFICASLHKAAARAKNLLFYRIKSSKRVT